MVKREQHGVSSLELLEGQDVDGAVEYIWKVSTMLGSAAPHNCAECILDGCKDVAVLYHEHDGVAMQ